MHALRLALAALILLAAPAAAEDENGRAEERAAMVETIRIQIQALTPETGVGEIDERILDAMRALPRHEFVPEPVRAFAYGNHPLPVSPEQNIAQPLIVALMTQMAAVSPGDRVYETGTGAGYHAAVLASLGAEVASVEFIEPLARRAAETLARMGFDTVEVRVGDGYEGWPERAPFDAIIVKESVDHIPAGLMAQLKPGGRMVLPLGPDGGAQVLSVVTKGDNGEADVREVLPVRFSPFQGGDRI